MICTQERDNPIALFTREAIIKRHLRRHLKKLGFTKDQDGRLQPPDLTKETIRAMHSAQRNARLKAEQGFIQNRWESLKTHFASGFEVEPERMSPRIEMIKGGTWQSDLFRLASLTWSVPVSQGYGRRMRFLVWDDANDKLIGLLALGDPVFNLKARDKWIGWTLEQRKSLLVNVMDAYVLGALPPYNMLLGGKLVASLVATKEIVDRFEERYTNSEGIISKKIKRARLCLVTTSSALGRSSLYNRLSLNGTKIFEPIGYSSGWGHFHIPEELFARIRAYLEERGDSYACNNRYGQGPNWRLRAIKKALTLIGMPPDLLQHGIGRELFVCKIAGNARKILAGNAAVPSYKGLHTVETVGGWAKERWLIPRAKQKPEYERWKKSDMRLLLHNKMPLVMDHGAESLDTGGNRKR